MNGWVPLREGAVGEKAPGAVLPGRPLVLREASAVEELLRGALGDVGVFVDRAGYYGNTDSNLVTPHDEDLEDPRRVGADGRCGHPEPGHAVSEPAP